MLLTNRSGGRTTREHCPILLKLTLLISLDARANHGASLTDLSYSAYNRGEAIPQSQHVVVDQETTVGI